MAFGWQDIMKLDSQGGILRQYHRTNAKNMRTGTNICENPRYSIKMPIL